MSGNTGVIQNPTIGNGLGNDTVTKFVKPVVKVPEVKQPEVIVDKEPHTKVDISADFPGGIEKFRKGIQQNFEVADFEGNSEVLQAKITFIVEKDGTITNIKATGADKTFNEEAIKAVKSVRGKWYPAKIKGELVRSYFSVPITMAFE